VDGSLVTQPGSVATVMDDNLGVGFVL